MQQSNYSKEQVHKIQATPQEMDAWEALRREPGLMGRLARRGKHMKRDYVGGRRSFQPPGGGETNLGSGAAGGRTESQGGQFGDSYGPGRSSSGSSGGGESDAQRKAREEAARKAAEEAARKKAEEEAKKAKLEKEEADRVTRRGELTDEFGGYKEDYKGLMSEADYSGARGKLTGYQEGADRMAGEAGTKFGGYESQIGQMADRGGEVAGLGTKMGQMATDATDTQKLMEDRGLFAGQIEAQRKAGEKGKMANLRRSMASAGSSPEEIARAEAEASGGAGGAGQSAREDAIAASMGAMGAKQSQMAQASGMLQGQAGMLGQAQNLGLQKTGAQAGMYQNQLQAQTGLMQLGGQMVGQEADLQYRGGMQQQGLIGAQAGMTRDQLQDVVAQQNAARQERLAREGIMVQQQANAANQPQGPSQSEQMMGMVKTGAMVKVAMACIPEGTTIDMASGHKVPIEEIKVGDFVVGLDNKKDEVLQVHQYKEDPEPARFATVTFDDGSMVNCCDKHRISNKRAEDYKLQDNVGNREVTSIDWYNGVNRSYDLLTATGGYRINGVPVNTMIPEMAEAIAEFNTKLAA